ncbi:hypothetical protein W03_01780 [Nitrosomonas sp. PY1]|nr:hypothetical protein W03_01780 [Nitrosomonas sp. PY1]
MRHIVAPKILGILGDHIEILLQKPLKEFQIVFLKIGLTKSCYWNIADEYNQILVTSSKNTFPVR